MKRHDEKREAPHLDLLLINPVGRELICQDLWPDLTAAELEREG